MKITLIFFLTLSFQFSAIHSVVQEKPVIVSVGKAVIPTYQFGRIETLAPLFETSDVRGLYPYSSFDRETLSEHPIPTDYESLQLENEFLKIVILPELGGRIWSAFDKVRGKELFYNPGSIKPTSYNQRGAWPAGNLEVYGPYDAHMLTWPGEPWAWAMESNEDGSASVVLSHIDHFFRNKLSMKVTLYPGKNFLELSVNLHNRMPVPNRYLLWTNAGLPATDGTRFIYPMTRTIGHDSAEFGEWPVFQGSDLSWYRNNKVMLGVFGLDVYDDFMGAYDYEADFGTLCYADRDRAKGIKTWTWGTGQVGLRHIEQYSDTGIPYIEVQSGRFVWDGNYEFIGPGKSDGWTEQWFAVSGLGGITTANKNVAASINPLPDQPGALQLKLTSTANYPAVNLQVSTDSDLSQGQTFSLTVGEVFEQVIQFNEDLAAAEIQFRITARNAVLLDYTYAPGREARDTKIADEFIPRKFGPPDQLTTEELFQKGITNEKLGRLAEARIAYQEALSRDPKMIGPNIQLGLLAWSEFESAQAVKHFENVLERDPFNGDALYYLGMIQSEMGNSDSSRELFYRLLPSSGNFELREYGLGLLALRSGHYSQAQKLFESAAEKIPTHLSIRQANAFALRKIGENSLASGERDSILQIDPTNAFTTAEKAFESNWDLGAVKEMERACANNPQGYLELATEYLALGGWDELEKISSHAVEVLDSRINENPLPIYYQAYGLIRNGDTEQAANLIKKASNLSLELTAFPFRRETLTVLNSVLELVPEDPNALTLLGMLYYSKSKEEAGRHLWDTATKAKPNHFTSLEHLGWAQVEEGQIQQALVYLERASQIRPKDPGLATGIARLYARAGRINDGLRVVETAMGDSRSSDRLLELFIRLKALKGDYLEAQKELKSHRFGTRHQSYSLLRLYQGVQLLRALELSLSGSFQNALSEIETANHPPANLGVDDFATLVSSRLLLFRALTDILAGDAESSRRVWIQAAQTADQDADGEGLFRTIGLFMSGRQDEAEKWFDEFELVNRQRKKDNDTSVKIHAHYLSGIYSIFRGEDEKGREELELALREDESNLFVRHALLWLDSGFFRFD